LVRFCITVFKTIKDGDYKETMEHFANRKSEFSNLIFEKLSYEVLKKSMIEDPISLIGSYWDRDVEIDILARTTSGKIVVGSCKYANSKATKSDLTKLKEKCDVAKIKPDIHVLFSKSGFSSELKNEKGENLKLFALKSFKTLLEDLSEKDFIACEGKRY
jgi:uncharacterized protein